MMLSPYKKSTKRHITGTVRKLSTAYRIFFDSGFVKKKVINKTNENRIYSYLQEAAIPEQKKARERYILSEWSLACKSGTRSASGAESSILRK